MNVWLIGAKTVAFITVAACIVGLAASITTLVGDFKSMGSTALASNTFGILMKRAAKSAAKASKKDKEKCQAYRYGTDYNQRPGAIFHAALYHLLSIVILVVLVIHQTLRGLSGNSLGTLYRIIPAPVGKWGLSSSGAVMIYLGVQIFSYNIGKIHVTAAILLIFAGLLNTVCAFIPGIASVAGTDAYSSDGGDYPPGGDMPYDDFDGMGGPPGGGMGGDPDAPDPYDGKDPNDPTGMPYDGTEGIGASAPPPGAVTGDAAVPGQTFGVPPNGMAPLNGYGQSNSENNPNLLQASNAAAGLGGVPANGTAQGTNEVVFDPATGQWATIFRPSTTQPAASDATTAAATQPSTNMQMPQIAMPAAAVMQPTIGYDMYGRPVMTQTPAVLPSAMAPYGAMATPQMLAPQMPQMPQQVAAQPAEDPEQKRREAKRAARKEARKQYDRMREEEEEAAIREEEEEAMREERRALRKERGRAKEARRRDKHQQDLARAEAEHDAQYRKVREAAEEEARKRQSEQALLEKRALALADARQQAMQRERQVREAEELQRAMAQQQHEVLKAQAMASAREAARLNPGPPSRQPSPLPPSSAHTPRSDHQQPSRRQPSEYRDTYMSGTTARQSEAYTTASRPASMAETDYDRYSMASTAYEPSRHGRGKAPELIPPVPQHPQLWSAAGGSSASRYARSERTILSRNKYDAASAVETSFSTRAPTVNTVSRRKEDRASKSLLKAQEAAERKRVLAQQAFEREKESHGGSMPPYGQQRYSNPLAMPTAGQYIPPEVDALAEETLDFQAGSMRSGSDNMTRSGKSRQLYLPPDGRGRAPSDQGSVRSGFSGWSTYDQYDESRYA